MIGNVHGTVFDSWMNGNTGGGARFANGVNGGVADGLAWTGGGFRKNGVAGLILDNGTHDMKVTGAYFVENVGVGIDATSGITLVKESGFENNGGTAALVSGTSNFVSDTFSTWGVQQTAVGGYLNGGTVNISGTDKEYYGTGSDTTVLANFQGSGTVAVAGSGNIIAGSNVTVTGSGLTAANAGGIPAGLTTITSKTGTGTSTAAPVVTEALVSDTGSSASDGITSSAGLHGTADAGATIHFSVDGTALAVAVANASGAWSFTPTGLADGQHTIVASETNAAGQTGSSSLTLMLDTTAPMVTEALVGGGTSSTTGALVGTSAANAVVHFTVDGTAVAATATADASGNWSYTPTDLSAGAHTVVASTTDLAGNAGSASLTFSIAAGTKTVAPATSTMPTFTSGSYANGQITLAGTTPVASETVWIYDGNNWVGAVTSDASGKFTFSEAATSGSSHTFGAIATDSTGNQTKTASTFAYTAATSTTPPSGPAVTAELATDTGSSATDKITSVATLSGTADPNATVHFTVDGTAVTATATANANGAWSFTPTGLADGAHTIVASETNTVGTGSASVSDTLDTRTPPVTSQLASDTGASATDKITSNSAISGTADPNAMIKFTVDGTGATQTVIADATGKWLFTPTSLADGQHTVVASETDVAGNTSSASVAFFLDTTSPMVTSVTAIANNDVSMLTAGDVLTITLHISETVVVTGIPTLHLNDNAVATYVGGSGNGALTFEYAVQSADSTADLQVDGLNVPWGATISDAAGNSLAAPIFADLGLQVGHPAAPPVASGDAYVGLQGQAATASVLDGVLLNDNGDSLTSTLVDAPAHGTLQLGTDGSFSYHPTAGFTGIDSFTYAATNGAGTSDTQALLYVVPTNTQGSTTTLALLSLTPEEQVAATYIAFFGRGADQSGFGFWVNLLTQSHNGLSPSQLFANIASSFGVSPEAQGLYPFLVNPQAASDAQISSFLNGVYENLFDRPGDAAGLVYWTGQIQQAMAAGQFVGSVLVNIIGGAQNTSCRPGHHHVDGQALRWGLEYVHQQAQLKTAWSFAQDGASSAALLHAVTGDPSTVLTGIKQADLLIHADAH